VKNVVPGKEFRERLGMDDIILIDTTAEQVAMVWACAARRGHWLGEEVCGVWGGGLRTRR